MNLFDFIFYILIYKNFLVNLSGGQKQRVALARGILD